MTESTTAEKSFKASRTKLNQSLQNDSPSISHCVSSLSPDRTQLEKLDALQNVVQGLTKSRDSPSTGLAVSSTSSGGEEPLFSLQTKDRK